MGTGGTGVSDASREVAIEAGGCARSAPAVCLGIFDLISGRNEK